MARGDGGTRKRTYQRKDGTSTRWVGWLDLGPGRDRQGRRRTRILEEKQFARERDAKEWLARRRAELRLAGPVDRRNDGVTVGELLDSYLDHGETLGDWSPGHRRRTRQITERDLAPLRLVPAEELTVGDVEALFARRQRAGASPNTIRLTRNALSAALSLAIRREQLQPWANVAARAKAPTVRREPPRYIPPTQVPDFIASLEGERYRPLFLTAMTLALRPSEAVGLRWEDVDLERREVTVRGSLQHVDRDYHDRERPKDDEARTIALPLFLTGVLREHRRAQADERQADYSAAVVPTGDSPSAQRRALRSLRAHDERRTRRLANEARWPGLVFTARDGGPVYEPALNRRLKVIVARVNARRLEALAPLAEAPELMPVVTCYQLRHTGATWMLATGVPEHELQAIMGHSSPAMTRRYAAVLLPQRRAAADRLDAFVDAAADSAVGRPVGRESSEASARGEAG